MNDWKKKIKDSAEDIEVPEGLKPEEIQKKLNEEMEHTDSVQKTIPFYRRRKPLAFIAAAAIVLCVGVSWRMGIWQNAIAKSDNRYSESAGAMAEEDSTEAAAEDAADAQTADAASADTASESADTASESAGGGSADAESADAASESAGGGSADAGSAVISEEGKKADFGEFYHTSTYEDIEKQMKAVWEEQSRQYDVYEGEMTESTADTAGTADRESAADDSTNGSSGSAESTGTGDMAQGQADYSTTNLQTEGVDEGDMIKTDGTYIYILRTDGTVIIFDAKKQKKVAEISPDTKEGERTYSEMYVDNRQLILVGELYRNELESDTADVYYMNHSYETIMVTYNLSDISSPKKVGTFSQDGSYRTSRKVGNYVYLFSDFYCHDEENGRVFPQVDGKVIAEDDIYVPDVLRQTNYLVMASVNTRHPDKAVDQKTLLDSGAQFYISRKSIYVIRTDWKTGQTCSDVIRFEFNNGKIKGVSAAILKGELTDTFAINEYDGYLRMMLTDWSGTSGGPTNRVYVVDMDMNVCGRIENLAEGETIYSARFMGNTGYFVTYRNTDPLFSVDFSDPKEPKIIGELKVTGFSDYLHFYGDGKLMGLGWETDPDTGEMKGLKLSMYDITDPANVKEENKIVLKGIDICDALNDYKKILIDAEKNIIGFSAGDYDENGYHGTYFVFSYDSEGGFKAKVNHALDGESDYGYVSSYETIGGLYIGNDLYVVEEDKITVYDMNSEIENKFEKTGSLELG
jgi:inhibitor of cysteine peptidase